MRQIIDQNVCGIVTQTVSYANKINVRQLMPDGLGEIMGSIGTQHVRVRIKTWRVFVDFMLIQETNNHQQT